VNHTRTFTDNVEAYFRKRPGLWIAAIELEAVGGRQAWRTRVSEVRRERGLNIQNRTRRVRRMDGTHFTLSEYRLVAPEGQMALL
jgi:hypothetical protein